ncbi:MAG TPA: hypothetical protein DHV36_14170 [Desulfobacteraceae bacterium]|nr:hypothetical protein [Desulfobacteraceae bacterium]
MQLNIAYIVHTLNPGGTERLALDMAVHYSTRGEEVYGRKYRVVIICLDEPGTWAELAKAQGITVHCVRRRPGLDKGLPFRLAGIFRSEGIAIVHAHQYTPWFYSGLARLFCPGIKLIFQEHGRHYPEVDKPRRRWFNRLVLQHLNTVSTAVSEDIRQRLIDYEGLSGGHIRVIYNGTRPQAPCSDSERTELRAEFGFGPEDLVVGTVGRLDPIKNLDLFIDGIYQIRQTQPSVKGLIIGDGPEMGHLRAKTAYLKLQESIIFTGFRADAADLVRMTDVFALVSFSEGTSMALLEAMASGVCPIVTDVGGNPEIVLDRETGWVVPSGDLTAFTAALKDAVLYQSMRQAFGKASRDRFIERFDFGTMTDAYHRLYSEIAGRV